MAVLVAAPTLLATMAFTASLAGSVSAAPALDANGKCRDGGKFVAADKCKKTS
jgi:hypothetical protein